MKTKLMMVVMALAVVLGVSASVKAVGPFGVSGRWAGTAFANPAFDFNGDGIAARTFDVKAYDELPFSGIEGVTDTGLVSIGSCAPGALELKPYGTFTFRGRLGDSLFAEVNPAAPNLCFDPANPNETLSIVLTGGTGIYAHASGTGVMHLHDVTRLTTPVFLPGFPGPLPAPTLIDTHGEFTLTFQ